MHSRAAGKAAILLFGLLISTAAQAQQGRQGEGVEGGEGHRPPKRHRLSAFVGLTHIPSGETEDEGDPVWVPTVGLDYEFWFSHTFALGIYNDVELGRYVIGMEGLQAALNRHYAFVTAAVGVWEPVRGLALFAGPGIELEQHETFFVLKLGTQFGLPLGKWWDLGGSVTYDWNEVYGTLSLGISVGKRFGPAITR